MIKRFTSLAFIIFSCLHVTQSALLLNTCDGSPTCSPASCPAVKNSACISTTSTINVTESVSQIPCNSSCTQSSLALCQSSQLAKVFAKGLPFGVKAVYCTDQYLVVHADGTPNHADSLSLIPRPPGDSSSCNSSCSPCNYDCQCVTRTRQTQFFSFKIPLFPVALSTSNASINNVKIFPSNSMLPNAALPVAGPAGISITGMPIFPAYNNNGQLTWSVCEVDKCNAHVGQGFDYHYHGDPFSNINGSCMYSPADYQPTTAAHPPLIGFSADGFFIYGRYLNVLAPGYSVALDDCGGHVHENYTYHYHAQVLTQSASGGSNLPIGTNYTAYIPGPYKCWKGDISKLNGFWDNRQVAYGSGRMAPSNLFQRGDYSLVKPCCNSNNYVAVSGVALQLSASLATTTSARSPLPLTDQTTQKPGSTLPPTAQTTQKPGSTLPPTAQTTQKPGSTLPPTAQTTQKPGSSNPTTLNRSTNPGSETTTSSSIKDSRITSWIKTTGTGYGNIVNNVDCVQYSTNYVYIHTNNIPSYTIGPWAANPNTPVATNSWIKFARNPTASTTNAGTTLGAMGVLLNGVALYNPNDAFSYNNMNIWQRNAYFNEKISFDACNGHPAPNGQYHNHINPVCLYNSTNSLKHSPLLGFLFDGFPIYGPFGYSTANNSNSAIKRIQTSYTTRNITVRTSLVNGPALTTSQYGPPVSTTYPLGNYIQDYMYVAGLGDLDVYNGRYCVTPEFPSGTYAYFVSSDSNNNPVYPYLTGPQYYGNYLVQQSQTAPTEAVTTYFCSTSSGRK